MPMGKEAWSEMRDALSCLRASEMDPGPCRILDKREAPDILGVRRGHRLHVLIISELTHFFLPYPAPLEQGHHAGWCLPSVRKDPPGLGQVADQVLHKLMTKLSSENDPSLPNQRWRHPANGSRANCSREPSDRSPARES